MARGRMLDRSIATSRKIAQCNRSEQWLYMRLMPFVDDEGKLPGDLFELKHLALPAEKIGESDLRKFITKLHDVGLYRFAEGEVIEVVGFVEHQKIGHRPAKSQYPDYQGVTGKGSERSERFAECKPALTSIKLNYKKENKVNSRKPTVEEVAKYMASDIKNRLSPVVAESEAAKWHDYYSSNGWKVGKNPMKDWRAAVRNWLRNINRDKPAIVDPKPQQNTGWCYACEKTIIGDKCKACGLTESESIEAANEAEKRHDNGGGI